MEVCQWRDALHLILPKALIDKVQRILAKPAQFSRVQLTVSHTLSVLGYWHQSGENPPFHCPESTFSCLATEDYLIDCLHPQFYLLLATEAYRETLPVESNSHPWHQARLQQGAVEIYAHTSEQFLPHRLNLQETPCLSFTKGCYRGQEIIARTHYRATLKHRLVQYQVTSKDTLTPGMEILDEQHLVIGELVDVCLIGEQQYLISASLLIEHPMHARFGTNQPVVELLPY